MNKNFLKQTPLNKPTIANLNNKSSLRSISRDIINIYPQSTSRNVNINLNFILNKNINNNNNNLNQMNNLNGKKLKEIKSKIQTQRLFEDFEEKPKLNKTSINNNI